MQSSSTPSVTLRDVAAAAGVSVATCSYALSGRSDRARPVPAETLAKVLAAAEHLGYSGNAAARVLRRQRTELVAVVYAPPVGPWLDRLTMQCEDIAAEHGYSVIGVPIRHPERTEHSLRVLTQGYVDGVIFAPGLADDLDLGRLSRSTRAMTAFSERLRPDHADVIRNDVRAAVADAAEYLLDQGRRRIAFLSHGHRNPSMDERYQGYLDALRRRGVAIAPALVRVGASQREEAMIAARDLFQLPDPPDAIISESDRGAFAALQVAAERGLAVPQDVAVVGIGNTQEASFSFPPLTSIGMYQLDFTAVIERLFTRIDEPTTPAQELAMPWVLNRRASA